MYILENELYPRNWKKISPNEEEIREEFCAIMKYFRQKNWHHYEISNFCQNGHECFHNQAYWTHKNVVGFGLSASSFVDNQRWSNSPSFAGYYQKKLIDFEKLSQESIELEKMMFGLRTFSWEYFDNEIFSPKKIQKYLDLGLLEQKNQKIFPTHSGIFLLDHIMTEIVN